MKVAFLSTSCPGTRSLCGKSCWNFLFCLIFTRILLSVAGLDLFSMASIHATPVGQNRNAAGPHNTEQTTERLEDLAILAKRYQGRLEKYMSHWVRAHVEQELKAVRRAALGLDDYILELSTGR